MSWIIAAVVAAIAGLIAGLKISRAPQSLPRPPAPNPGPAAVAADHSQQMADEEAARAAAQYEEEQRKLNAAKWKPAEKPTEADAAALIAKLKDGRS